MKKLSKIKVEYDEEEGTITLDFDMEAELHTVPVFQRAADYFKNLTELSLETLRELRESSELLQVPEDIGEEIPEVTTTTSEGEEEIEEEETEKEEGEESGDGLGGDTEESVDEEGEEEAGEEMSEADTDESKESESSP